MESKKAENKTTITVPQHDIIIQPIFRAIPGYSVQSSEHSEGTPQKETGGSDTVSDKSIQTITDEYKPRHKELHHLSSTENTQTGIIRGFKL